MLDIEKLTKAGDCEKHGPYMATGIRIMSRIMWSRCPACAEDRAKDLGAESDGNVLIGMRDAGVPLRYAFNRFCDMDTSVASSVITLLAAEIDEIAGNAGECKQDVGKFIILSGGTGVGKTHMGCAMIRSLFNIVSCRYEVETEWLSDMRATWNRDSEQTEAQVFARAAKPRLLVLDEFAMSQPQPWKQEIVSRLIDYRYSNRKTTVMLTNEPPASIAPWVGDRAADRMRQCSRVKVINGESFRRRMSAAE